MGTIIHISFTDLDLSLDFFFFFPKRYHEVFFYFCFSRDIRFWQWRAGSCTERGRLSSCRQRRSQLRFEEVGWKIPLRQRDKSQLRLLYDAVLALLRAH